MKCIRCGSENAHLLGSFDGRPSIIQCDDCGCEAELKASTKGRPPKEMRTKKEQFHNPEGKMERI